MGVRDCSIRFHPQSSGQYLTMKTVILIHSFFAISLAQIDHPNFAEQKAIRLRLDNKYDGLFVEELQNIHLYDVLQFNARKGFADILMEKNDKFLPKALAEANIPYETVVENVQDVIDWERDLIERKKKQHSLSKQANEFDLENYHSYEEIIQYLNDLEGKKLAY